MSATVKHFTSVASLATKRAVHVSSSYARDASGCLASRTLASCPPLGIGARNLAMASPSSSRALAMKILVLRQAPSSTTGGRLAYGAGQAQWSYKRRIDGPREFFHELEQFIVGRIVRRSDDDGIARRAAHVAGTGINDQAILERAPRHLDAPAPARR